MKRISKENVSFTTIAERQKERKERRKDRGMEREQRKSREWVGEEGRRKGEGREVGREEERKASQGRLLMILECIAGVLSCTYIETESYHALDIPWIAPQN